MSHIKNKKNEPLNEGFLDGEEEIPVSSDSIDSLPEDEAGEEVVELEDKPIEDEETDISEEPYVEDPESEEETEYDGSADENADDGVEDTPDEVSELKDAIATLTAEIQELKDTFAKSNNAASDEGEEAEVIDDEDTADEDDDSEFEDDSDSEDDSSEDDDFEGDEEDSDEESSDDEESDDESSDDEDSDEENEAYKYFVKKGRCLSENSSFLIGKLYNNRYDKLEAPIMGIIKSKINEKIDAEKKKIRQAAYDKKFGK